MPETAHFKKAAKFSGFFFAPKRAVLLKAALINFVAKNGDPFETQTS